MKKSEVTIDFNCLSSEKTYDIISEVATNIRKNNALTITEETRQQLQILLTTDMLFANHPQKHTILPYIYQKKYNIQDHFQNHKGFSNFQINIARNYLNKIYPSFSVNEWPKIINYLKSILHSEQTTEPAQQHATAPPFASGLDQSKREVVLNYLSYHQFNLQKNQKPLLRQGIKELLQFFHMHKRNNDVRAVFLTLYDAAMSHDPYPEVIGLNKDNTEKTALLGKSCPDGIRKMVYASVYQYMQSKNLITDTLSISAQYMNACLNTFGESNGDLNRYSFGLLMQTAMEHTGLHLQANILSGKWTGQCTEDNEFLWSDQVINEIIQITQKKIKEHHKTFGWLPFKNKLNWQSAHTIIPLTLIHIGQDLTSYIQYGWTFTEKQNADYILNAINIQKTYYHRLLQTWMMNPASAMLRSDQVSLLDEFAQEIVEVVFDHNQYMCDEFITQFYTQYSSLFDTKKTPSLFNRLSQYGKWQSIHKLISLHAQYLIKSEKASCLNILIENNADDAIVERFIKETNVFSAEIEQLNYHYALSTSHKLLPLLIKHQSPGINQREAQFNRTPLIALVIKSQEPANIKLLEKLIQTGAHIDAVDRFNKSALMYALENRSHHAALILIKHGANHHILDNEGKGAIDFLAQNPHTETLHALLKQPTLNTVNIIHKLLSPLHKTSSNHLFKETYLAIKTCLEHPKILEQIKNNELNAYYQTPLMAALRCPSINNEYISAIIALLSNITPHQGYMHRDLYQRTALHYYCMNADEHNPKLFQNILDKTPYIDLIDAQGETPLTYLAATPDLSEHTLALTNRGASLNHTNILGSNALMISLKKHGQYMQILYSEMLSKKIYKQSGSLLMWVIQNFLLPFYFGDHKAHELLSNRKEACMMLIHDTPNINQQDLNGNTALIHEIRQYAVEPKIGLDVVHLLLNLNADISTTNNQGQNALMIVAQLGLSDCLELLLSVMHKKPQDISTIINAQDHTKNTLLMYSVHNTQCLNQVLKFQPSAHMANTSGETALSLATNKQHTHAATMIINYMASQLSAINSYNSNPRQFSSSCELATFPQSKTQPAHNARHLLSPPVQQQATPPNRKRRKIQHVSPKTVPSMLLSNDCQ